MLALFNQTKILTEAMLVGVTVKHKIDFCFNFERLMSSPYTRLQKILHQTVHTANEGDFRFS